MKEMVGIERVRSTFIVIFVHIIDVYKESHAGVSLQKKAPQNLLWLPGGMGMRPALVQMMSPCDFLLGRSGFPGFPRLDGRLVLWAQESQ